MELSSNTREIFKGYEYFDEQVKYNKQSLERFIAVAGNPATTQEHRLQLRHTIFRRHLEQLITRYSRGDAIDFLYDEFANIITALVEYQAESGDSFHGFEEFDAYIYAIWLVAIAILLNVPDEQFKTLLSLLNNRGHDALYDRLVSLRLPSELESTEIMYPKPYQLLYDALDMPEDRQLKLIGKFLKNYYKGMNKSYWHDSHLGEDAGFFGYWCFELAAFVKMCKINDSSFSDNVFYPRELVRWIGSRNVGVRTAHR